MPQPNHSLQACLTQMKVLPTHDIPDFDCLRCGSCCHVDMIAYVTDDDIERWKRERRSDILARVRGEDIIWAGDRIVSSSGRPLQSCVYLGWDGHQFFCAIYETRPSVCRNYSPGSSELCPLHG